MANMISHGQPSRITQAYQRKLLLESLEAGLIYARFYQGVAKGASQEQTEADIRKLQRAIDSLSNPQ